jgi:hypothetical protein
MSHQMKRQKIAKIDTESFKTLFFSSEFVINAISKKYAFFQKFISTSEGVTHVGNGIYKVQLESDMSVIIISCLKYYKHVDDLKITRIVIQEVGCDSYMGFSNSYISLGENENTILLHFRETEAIHDSCISFNVNNTKAPIISNRSYAVIVPGKMGNFTIESGDHIGKSHKRVAKAYYIIISVVPSGAMTYDIADNAFKSKPIDPEKLTKAMKEKLAESLAGMKKEEAPDSIAEDFV